MADPSTTTEEIELKFVVAPERVAAVRQALRRGAARIEVALDVGTVAADGRVEPIRELELELKSGTVDGLLQAASRWVETHALWIGTVSKAERGARLARGDARAAIGARAPKVDADV